MSSTAGMADDYDEHSEYQRRVADTGAALVESCVAALDLPDPPQPLVFVDLGSATGRNSLAAMANAVRAARSRSQTIPVACIHNDLLTNDWSALFSRIASAPDSYLSADDASVIPMAAAGSFFAPTVPSGFAHLQMSFSAAHWFREQPAEPIADGMYFSEARGRAREALAARAADDWEAFVAARAADLREGGRLVVQCVGTDRDADGREFVTARELLAAMWAVAVDMADDGLLDPVALERYVFPVYARMAEEARAPFERVDSAFELIEASVAPVPNPYLDAWHQDQDADTYAHDYAAFVRGFAETALARGLFDARGAGESVEALADEFFRRLEDRFRRRPEEDAFRDWTLTIVARRR